MSAPVETTLVDEPLRTVARRMVENRLKHLVVIDDARRMVGIVSRDLLRAFDRPDAEISADVEDAVSTSEYGGRVAATVDDAVVTLEGEVLRTEDVAAVCRLAWMVPGVVDVVYHLAVGTRGAQATAGGQPSERVPAR